VIVDLAPLVAGMGVRAMSGLIDSYVLVIEWGATKIDEVQYALRHAPVVQQNIVGAVLNKVNMAAMGRYDGYGANYYYGQPRHSNSLH
jgi:succinoglycan biosynthesis transport protein ExoP